MTESYEHKTGPMVSVLIPTCNRPGYFAEALASVVRQSYARMQIIVVNDGGRDVNAVVDSFNDPRIVFINRKENRGKAHSLNEAIERAEGKYIAYLDDDDLFYPHHIETLVNVLENSTDCEVAYSDLYKVYCRISPDGSRPALSKVVEVTRDFDRFVMLYFNHVLHVSLMHRRDLIDKTGPYNEKLNVMIDWDMTRRLVFFSDFHHVCEITGEFYQPAGDTERVSVKGRLDKEQYARCVMTIRTTRPPKPWPKMADLSIIFLSERLNKQAGATMGAIWRHTFYPYKLYLPLPDADFSRLNTDMPNIVIVPVTQTATQDERLDRALAQCEGEYVAIVPDGFPVGEVWVEDSLYALLNSSSPREGFELERSTDSVWAGVFRKEDLQYARGSFSQLSFRQSLKAAGIAVRRISSEQILFKFDSAYKKAQAAEKEGNWILAAEIYEHIAGNYQNSIWMGSLAAGAYFKAGLGAKARGLAHLVNQQRPTVATLLLEAKIIRKQGDFEGAIELLGRAERILSGEMNYQSLVDTRIKSGAER